MSALPRTFQPFRCPRSASTNSSFESMVTRSGGSRTESCPRQERRSSLALLALQGQASCPHKLKRTAEETSKHKEAAPPPSLGGAQSPPHGTRRRAARTRKNRRDHSPAPGILRRWFRAQHVTPRR